jgi:D-sedoheptulose 7-phosphate isomerase
MTRSFEDIRKEHLQVIQELGSISASVERVADRMAKSLREGGTIFFMGNGGSAGDSQHLAAELVGRFQRERAGLRAIALTTDTSVLTAIANDYGYDCVFERQVAALCKSGDVVVGISTSGNSANVLRGLARAFEIGAHTVGMTGANNGKMVEVCIECIQVPSTSAARIQEAHILIGHALCELVEEAAGHWRTATVSTAR